MNLLNILKRPSHSKLKLANIGKLQKVGKRVPSHVKLASNHNTRYFATWPTYLVQSHSRRRVKQMKSSGETEQKKVWTKLS